MRIVTWNINGLATALQYHPWSETKSYKVLLDSFHADIICLQEVKCQQSKLTREMAIVPGYHAYFSFSKAKLGYSGVAVYLKDTLPQPRLIQETIADDDLSLLTPAKALDAEGRSLVLDFGHFVLFNIYFPNDAGDARTQFKMDYHHAVQKRIEQALEHQHVILVGDINATHEPIDHCDPQQSIQDHGLQDFKDLPQRRWLDLLVAPKGPLVDMTRRYHPGRPKMFTCWNTRINARPINYGTRIDYVLASTGLEAWFEASDIQPEVMGSDHCPVYADFSNRLMDSVVPQEHYRQSPLFSLNFPQFKHQHKLSDYFQAVKRRPPCEAQTIEDLPKKKNKRVCSSLDNYVIKKTNTTTTSTTSSTSSTSSTTALLSKSALYQDIDFNNQQTKTTWTSLFQTPEIPRCRHQEVCLEKTVTKKGPNLGRVFYVCSKPMRSQTSSSEENVDEFSCNFFMWKQKKSNGT